MINKYTGLLLLVFLLSGSFARGQTVKRCLERIEKNNPGLKASRKLMKAKRVEARTGIFPKPISVNFGYFPDNQTVVDHKQTLNATQSFYLPGVYKKMRNLAADEGVLAALAYQKDRKEILLRAQKLLIRLIYHRKRHQQLEVRLRYARQRYEGVREKTAAGGATLMARNKARLHLLRIRRAMNQNEIERNRLMEQLDLLNGRRPLELSKAEYPAFPDLKLDTMLTRKPEQMPSLLMAGQRVSVTEQRIDLKKALNGPELKLGYGAEVVGNSSFRGVVMGASIPLWTNKNQVRLARIQNDYRRLDYEHKLMELRSETRKQYDVSRSLRRDLKTWRTILGKIKTTELLRKSLQMGEISILDFYREVQYYYDIYDEYLALERDYHLVLAGMYQYRL